MKVLARPRKTGLEYFPLDVTAGMDDEIELLEAKFGLAGFAIYIKLLQAIYKNGYYINWTEKEQLLFIKRVNVAETLVNDVITACLQWKLFHKQLYEELHILTSHGIQQRFLFAIGRRSGVEMAEEYLLLSEKEINATKTLVNVTKTTVNVDSNAIKNRKEKNIESKEKEKESKPSFLSSSQIPFLSTFEKRFGLINTNQLTPSVVESLQFLESQNIDEKLFDEAIDISVENGKRSIGYVCGILMNWIGKDILTLDQLKEYIANKSKAKSSVSDKIAKFNSMYSNEYDFDELERLQDEHISRKLKENEERKKQEDKGD